MTATTSVLRRCRKLAAAGALMVPLGACFNYSTVSLETLAPDQTARFTLDQEGFGRVVNEAAVGGFPVQSMNLSNNRISGRVSEVGEEGPHHPVARRGRIAVHDAVGPWLNPGGCRARVRPQQHPARHGRDRGHRRRNAPGKGKRGGFRPASAPRNGEHDRPASFFDRGPVGAGPRSHWLRALKRFGGIQVLTVLQRLGRWHPLRVTRRASILIGLHPVSGQGCVCPTHTGSGAGRSGRGRRGL